MVDCKHYDKCPELEDDMKDLRTSDTLQTAAMKSIHKRMDKADEKRDELKKEVQDTHLGVHDLHIALETHMKWEEKQMEITNDNNEKNRALFSWMSAIVITIGLSFVGYTVTILNTTENATIKNFTHIESLDRSMVEIKDILKGQ